MSLDSLLADANEAMGRMKEDENACVEALNILKEADFLHRSNPAVHTAFAFYYFEINDLDEAIDHAQRAISEGNNTPAIFGFLAQMYRTQSDFKQEARILSETDRLFPNEPYVIFSLGKALFDSGRKKESIAPLTRYTEMTPHDNKDVASLIHTYRMLNDTLQDADPSRIVAFAQRSHMVNEQNKMMLGYVQLYASNAHVILHQFEAAQHRYEAGKGIFKAKADEPIVKVLLADISYGLGKNDKARWLYKRALAELSQTPLEHRNPFFYATAVRAELGLREAGETSVAFLKEAMMRQQLNTDDIRSIGQKKIFSEYHAAVHMPLAKQNYVTRH